MQGYSIDLGKSVMVYEVDNKGIKHHFLNRAQAMAYADDNNCYLVEGIKTLESAITEGKVKPETYRKFNNQLSKA